MPFLPSTPMAGELDLLNNETLNNTHPEKNMDKVIIYPNNEGGVAIVIPAPNCGLTIEQIAAKDVPPGKPYKIVNASEIPADRTFRNAWEYVE